MTSHPINPFPSEPIAIRLRYYNPVLDPHCQAKMTPAMLDAVENDTYEKGGPLNEPDAEHAANLVSSLCTDGLHRPALDIDVECELIESSTPGHHHLYFPTIALTWDAYQELLKALADAGIIEQRYADHSVERGQTLLRPPGVERALSREAIVERCRIGDEAAA